MGFSPHWSRIRLSRRWSLLESFRFCGIAASGVDELLDNMVSRGRGEQLGDRESARPNALANDAYNTWLV